MCTWRTPGMRTANRNRFSGLSTSFPPTSRDVYATIGPLFSESAGSPVVSSANRSDAMSPISPTVPRLSLHSFDPHVLSQNRRSASWNPPSASRVTSTFVVPGRSCTNPVTRRRVSVSPGCVATALTSNSSTVRSGGGLEYGEAPPGCCWWNSRMLDSVSVPVISSGSDPTRPARWNSGFPATPFPLPMVRSMSALVGATVSSGTPTARRGRPTRTSGSASARCTSSRRRTRTARASAPSRSSGRGVRRRGRLPTFTNFFSGGSVPGVTSAAVGSPPTRYCAAGPAPR